VDNTGVPSFLRRALTVGLYAAAMAYLEAAVVVYLQRALAIEPAALFPLRDQATLGGLGVIEVGREGATLLMLATVGWLAGRTGLERLAWAAVAFGIWDIGYYAWLWVFIGWPATLGATDLLFMLPVPWVAPVWAPVAVSLALVGFGLVVARRLRRGDPLRVGHGQLAAGFGGGIVVIVSFTLDAGRVLAGGMPSDFAWPVFVAGMTLAVGGAVSALRVPPARRQDAQPGVESGSAA
jgi:hypothetical protein